MDEDDEPYMDTDHEDDVEEADIPDNLSFRIEVGLFHNIQHIIAIVKEILVQSV